MLNLATQLIKVRDVRDDVYRLDNSSLRAVLAVPGINFSLLAEREKETIISQFKEFLDGLDFPIQTLAVSRLANVENYLALLGQRLGQETEPLIRVQLEAYISFIKEYVEAHKIMKKLFYLVVPYDPMTVEVGGLLRRSTAQREETHHQQLEQLETRVIYVSEKLSASGLQPIRLTTAELVQLLFESYNPSTRWGTAPIQLFEELVAQQHPTNTAG